MINQTMLDYVTAERLRGVVDADIQKALLAQGWKEEDIYVAFAGGQDASTAPALSAIPRVAPSFSLAYVKYLYTGRVGRFYYFEGSLIIFFLYLALAISLTEVYMLATGMSGFIESFDAHKSLFQFGYLPFIFVQFSLLIRRLHDLDRSGWWSVCSFIPVASFFFGVYVLFFKGTTGQNRFGAPSEYNKSTSWAWKAIWKI